MNWPRCGTDLKDSAGCAANVTNLLVTLLRCTQSFADRGRMIETIQIYTDLYRSIQVYTDLYRFIHRSVSNYHHSETSSTGEPSTNSKKCPEFAPSWLSVNIPTCWLFRHWDAHGMAKLRWKFQGWWFREWPDEWIMGISIPGTHSRNPRCLADHWWFGSSGSSPAVVIFPRIPAKWMPFYQGGCILTFLQASHCCRYVEIRVEILTSRGGQAVHIFVGRFFGKRWWYWLVHLNWTA